jgi:outer membrane protein TolC
MLSPIRKMSFVAVAVFGLVVVQQAKAESKSSVLTLNKAKEIAVQQSPTLGAAQERITQASWRIREAAAKYYPNLRFVSSATGYLRTPITDRNVSQGRGSDPYVLFGNYLESTWVVFDGFQRKFEKINAQHQARVARSLLADEHRLLALSVAKAYSGVMMARENVRLAGERLKLQEDLVASFSGPVDGVDTSRSVGDVDSEYAQVAELERLREEIVTAKLDEEIARMVLAELMNDSSGRIESEISEVPTLSKEFRSKIASTEDTYAIYSALSKRQDLEAASARISGRGALIKVEKASGMPRVILEARAGYQSVDNYSFNKDNQDVYGGIRVEWDIFDGNLRRARVKEAEAAEREATQELMAKTAQVRREVLVARAQVRSSMVIVDGRLKALQTASGKRDQVRERLQAGIATNTEMAFAEQLLVSEKARMSAASIEVLSAYENYMAAIAENLPAPKKVAVVTVEPAKKAKKSKSGKK